MTPFWILLELRMMKVTSVTIGAIIYMQTPVKSSPSTNQHPAFYRPDALSVILPTVSKLCLSLHFNGHYFQVNPG